MFKIFKDLSVITLFSSNGLFKLETQLTSSFFKCPAISLKKFKLKDCVVAKLLKDMLNSFMTPCMPTMFLKYEHDLCT